MAMPLDSKSSASTNSATLALMAHKKKNISSLLKNRKSHFLFTSLRKNSPMSEEGKRQAASPSDRYAGFSLRAQPSPCSPSGVMIFIHRESRLQRDSLNRDMFTECALLSSHCELQLPRLQNRPAHTLCHSLRLRPSLQQNQQNPDVSWKGSRHASAGAGPHGHQ